MAEEIEKNLRTENLGAFEGWDFPGG